MAETLPWTASAERRLFLGAGDRFSWRLTAHLELVRTGRSDDRIKTKHYGGRGLVTGVSVPLIPLRYMARKIFCIILYYCIVLTQCHLSPVP